MRSTTTRRLAAEAELTARQGNRELAAALFRRAADLTTTDIERRALLERANENLENL